MWLRKQGDAKRLQRERVAQDAGPRHLFCASQLCFTIRRVSLSPEHQINALSNYLTQTKQRETRANFGLSGII
eukprot:2737915-Amphidinium_carterae.1